MSRVIKTLRSPVVEISFAGDPQYKAKMSEAFAILMEGYAKFYRENPGAHLPQWIHVETVEGEKEFEIFTHLCEEEADMSDLVGPIRDQMNAKTTLAAKIDIGLTHLLYAIRPGIMVVDPALAKLVSDLKKLSTQAAEKDKVRITGRHPYLLRYLGRRNDDPGDRGE